MAEQTFTAADMTRMLAEMKAQVIAEAKQELANAQDDILQRDRLGLDSPPRRSVRNWHKSKLAWNAKTPAEKELALECRQLARDYQNDVLPILHAKRAVEQASRSGEVLDPATRERAMDNVERFNTITIEGLSERVHMGDGRKISKGQTKLCHPALARALELNGNVRIIEEADDVFAGNAELISIDSLARKR